jgi:ubiquinone biosynthesis monooxygenase Coq7
MKTDEAGHAVSARRQGAKTLPRPVRGAMKLLARVMTSTSHWI